MKKLFSPGCALMLYKPELADQICNMLIKMQTCSNMYTNCCHHKPITDKALFIINTCPGCHRRYSSLYRNVKTISLWEILAESDTFTFPDYKGAVMSIHDACPTKNKPEVHNAIRKIISRMNISLKEPEKTKTSSVCCGDTYYKLKSDEEVTTAMIKRAEEMPAEDVIVYCVSCVKSIHTGGKKPRYLPDLLFGQETLTNNETTKKWHDRIENYIRTTGAL